MIKIEITDIEKLDADVLSETGKYLMQLGARRHLHRHPSEEHHITDAQGNSSPLFKHIDKIMSGVKKETPEFEPQVSDEINDEHENIIDEELIPVPAESVCLHAPTAAEVFAPTAAEVFAPSIPVPPAAPVSSVELDTDGLPWDFRIHARTKTKMKDGSWKKLRGVGPELVKKVEAELKAVQNIPAPPAPVTSAPAIPVPPVPAPADTAPGFADLMTLVTKAITEGKLKRDQVTEVLKPFGIPSLPLVSTRLDLVPTIIAALNGVINAAQ